MQKQKKMQAVSVSGESEEIWSMPSACLSDLAPSGGIKLVGPFVDGDWGSVSALKRTVPLRFSNGFSFSLIDWMVAPMSWPERCSRAPWELAVIQPTSELDCKPFSSKGPDDWPASDPKATSLHLLGGPWFCRQHGKPFDLHSSFYLP